MSGPAILRFGTFELDCASGELRQAGNLVRLPPQPFKVLELLAGRSGEVVTRSQIRDHVWCDDTVVDFEQGLNFCIRRIREVLGDRADAPHFIETLPRRGYRFLVPVTGPPPTRPAVTITRLIVLPFRMLRPDPETEFLSFSLPDALTSSLGDLESLVVRSSMAAARFAGDGGDPRRIGAEADVDAIVSGTLLRAGSEIRVATQLTDAASGTLMWSHTEQAAVEDLFRVQDLLTRRIVASLALPLTQGEQQMLQRDVPVNARAYEYFLRANQLGNDSKQWSVARDLYLECLAEDPRYAPAWARLGRIHHVMGKFLPGGTTAGLADAEAAFRRALELNPDLTLAHKLYAQLEVDQGRAQDAMVRLLERARVSDPEIFAGLVSACRYCGLLEASVTAHARAVELDPKIRTSVMHTWFLQGDHARVVTIPIGDFPYIVSLSMAEQGRSGEAAELLRELEPRIPTRIRDFVVAARTLIEGEAAASVAAIERVVASEFGDPEGLFYLARQLARLGETAAAIRLCVRVVDGGYCCPSMARDPWLEPLRKRPAFTKLVLRVQARQRSAGEAFEQRGGHQVLAAAT